jgi:hypothetical protein
VRTQQLAESIGGTAIIVLVAQPLILGAKRRAQTR